MAIKIIFECNRCKKENPQEYVDVNDALRAAEDLVYAHKAHGIVCDNCLREYEDLRRELKVYCDKKREEFWNGRP